MTTTPFDFDWVPPGVDDGAPPPAAPPPPPGPDRRPRRPLLAGAALLAVGAVVGAVTAHAVYPDHGTGATPSTAAAGQQPVVPQQPGAGDAAALAQKIDPAVVDINTVLGYRHGEAAGTGIVLTSTGEVLTNNHVIAGATSIKVTDVGNGKTYTATVVGYDKSDDIAVLQLHGASGLTTATTSTNPARIGDQVVGVGNAGGAGGTPSYAAGVITATNQSITASDDSDGTSEQLTGLLQTDAAIVAGDSGGPLINTSGQVVGIDTAASAGFRFSQASEGYAIPIMTALQLARQIATGQASDTIHLGPTAMLGVGVQPDSAGGQSNGAVIANILSGGPASAAGLRTGDTITAIAGRTVTSADDLSNAILALRPGATVSVHYLTSNGVSRTTAAKLGNGPPQ